MWVQSGIACALVGCPGRGEARPFRSAVPSHAHRAYRSFRAAAVHSALFAPRPAVHFGSSLPRAAPGRASRGIRATAERAYRSFPATGCGWPLISRDPRHGPPRTSGNSRIGPRSTRFPRHCRSGHAFHAAGDRAYSSFPATGCGWPLISRDPRHGLPRISGVSRIGPRSTRFPRHARLGSGGMNGFRAAGRPGTAQFGGSRPAGRSYRPI